MGIADKRSPTLETALLTAVAATELTGVDVCVTGRAGVDPAFGFGGTVITGDVRGCTDGTSGTAIGNGLARIIGG